MSETDAIRERSFSGIKRIENFLKNTTPENIDETMVSCPVYIAKK